MPGALEMQGVGRELLFWVARFLEQGIDPDKAAKQPKHLFGVSGIAVWDQTGH